jgi:uncharacterized membrane protein
MLNVLLLAVLVLAEGAADVCVTRAMKSVGEVNTLVPRELLRIARRVLATGAFRLGLLFMTTGFFAFLALLARVDMSVVVPATALIYVVSMLGAKYVLKEEVSTLRWAGTALVCLGVVLTSLP